MKYGKFDIEPQVYREMSARGESPKACDGCGEALLAVRDIRKRAYCINCAGKVGRLSRYSNASYNPTEAERQRILKSVSRI